MSEQASLETKYTYILDKVPVYSSKQKQPGETGSHGVQPHHQFALTVPSPKCWSNEQQQLRSREAVKS